MEKKKTIKIGEYAEIKNKSKQGIYQAIKRPNNKYQKYITTDEEGKTVFKIDILKGLREILDNTGKADVDLVIIEDSLSVLLDVTELNNPKIKCYMISDFI